MKDDFTSVARQKIRDHIEWLEGKIAGSPIPENERRRMKAEPRPEIQLSYWEGGLDANRGCLGLLGMLSERTVFKITVLDMQLIAHGWIGRELTEEELEKARIMLPKLLGPDTAVRTAITTITSNLPDRDSPPFADCESELGCRCVSSEDKAIHCKCDESSCQNCRERDRVR